jgi:hypothetical protein
MKRDLNLLKNSLEIVTATLIIFWFVSGCEHAELMQSQGGNFQSGSVDSMATFSWIQANVFNQNCAIPACHVQGSAAFGLVLSEGQAYGNLVDIPAQGPQSFSILRVKPGDPDSSYLVWKLEGRSGIEGVQMPRGRPPLPQEEIDAIKRWIQGATRNEPND